jgi:hypothetical protein
MAGSIVSWDIGKRAREKSLDGATWLRQQLDRCVRVCAYKESGGLCTVLERRLSWEMTG